PVRGPGLCPVHEAGPLALDPRDRVRRKAMTIDGEAIVDGQSGAPLASAVPGPDRPWPQGAYLRARASSAPLVRRPAPPDARDILSREWAMGGIRHARRGGGGPGRGGRRGRAAPRAGVDAGEGSGGGVARPLAARGAPEARSGAQVTDLVRPLPGEVGPVGNAPEVPVGRR